jgi:magnesium transporter
MAKRLTAPNPSLNTSPGTLTYVGQDMEHDIRIRLIEYNARQVDEREIKKLSECRGSDRDDVVTWLNVDGIHRPDVVGEIGRHYGLHPLLLEDVLNTQQKPKLDYYGEDVLFVVLKWLEFNPFNREVEAEHVSLVLGNQYVISFQEERDRDIFAPIRERLRASAGKTRTNGADYLLYALFDTVVDNYLLVTEKLGEQLETLEERLFQSPRERIINDLYSVKREVMLMRKAVYPLRELVNNLLREAGSEESFLTANTQLYLRDVSDHVSQAVETLDGYRELVASLMDLYQSTVSNRLNNVLKVLTVISVIFMPLTFVAGIYGMNFDYIPWLHWRYGFWAVMAVMIGIVGLMLYWFRRREWL